MNVTSHVTSLELSKRLHELGIKQESLFWWTHVTGRYFLRYFLQDDSISEEESYSAFTISELLELLPDIVEIEGVKYRLIINKNGICYSESSTYEWLKSFSINSFEKSIVNCLVKMLIHLKENNLINL